MSIKPRARRMAVVLATCLVGAVWAATLPFAFVHHGHFQRMMHSGDTSGQVDLSALPQARGTWGLGATGDLQGEIVQLDGRLLVSPGSDTQGRVRAPVPGERALLFASGQVHAWQDLAVPRDMDAAAFEAFVQAQASRLGLALDQPFVFRVEGRFPHLLWHVVTGQQQAAGGPGRAGGHGAHSGHSGHSGHGGQGGHSGHSGHSGQGRHAGGHGAHANQRSDMRLFHQPGASGQLVGVYSGAALEGAVSHPGERFHLHYADSAATVSGHVDRYSVAEGSTLKLPLR